MCVGSFVGSFYLSGLHATWCSELLMHACLLLCLCWIWAEHVMEWDGTRHALMTEDILRDGM